MQNFKQFLKENEELDADNTEGVLEELISKVPLGGNSFNYGLTSRNPVKVRIFGKLTIYSTFLEDGVFPVPLDITSNITVNAKELSSFKNFPNKIAARSFSTAFQSLQTCPLVTSLEGFANEVDGDVYFGKFPNLSLEGIGKKYLKIIKGTLTINSHYKGPLLGLFLINYLDDFYREVSDDNSRELLDALRIIRRNFNGEKDILDCQEELITKGFKEYAKL